MIRQIENGKSNIRHFIKSAVPASLKRGLQKAYHHYFLRRPPLVGEVRFGDLRRLQAISDVHGKDRGQSITRYYIEKFLDRHTEDIRGRVLEIGDDRYTRQFGRNKVIQSDVLHYTEGNPQATIVADLTKADNIASDAFDCIIMTQTLQMIYDVRAALKHVHRMLKPGGILLTTSHGTSKIDRFLGIDPWGEYWRFTGQSSQMMFEEFFKPGDVTIETYGNVLTAISFLHGLAAEDLRNHELDYRDPEYEVLIGVRALKSPKSN